MDIGRILGAGPRLIQAHPAAAAVWTAINILLAALSQYGLSSMFASMLAGAGTPDLGAMMSSMGTLYAVQCLAMLVQLLLWAAVYRAVFRPDKGGFAFLRVSGDEGRLLLLGLLSGLIFMGIIILIFLPMGFIAGFNAASGSAPGAGPILISLALSLVLFIALIFISVRFALAWPIAVAENRIALGEAWRLSRGRFWPMFAAALVIIIGFGIASQIVSTLQFGGLLAGMTPGADPEAFQRTIIERFTTLSVTSVIAWVLGGIVSTAWIVCMGAGIADALVQLRPDDHDDLAEIYA